MSARLDQPFITPDSAPLRALLPSLSFVPFTARALARPLLVYLNPAAPQHVPWCSDFGYLVPSELDSAADFVEVTKEFYAERYGGFGVLSHGGGARVGLDGSYQVKGIGRNPLCGLKRTPGEVFFGYSHGGLTLVDAVKEAAWGEAFYYALPHRAVRVAAVIATRTDCWSTPARYRAVRQPRALVIREAVVRPAHFLRACFFKPTGLPSLPHDARRVEAAVARLAETLPLPDNLSTLKLSSTERLTEGMREFVRRCAEQSAAARAKRLLHGALVSSNMCLDGRWIDFGTASALPHYANTHPFGTPPHISTFWEDELPCTTTIRALCFNARKHLHDIPAPVVDPEPLLQLFADHYQAALRRNFVSLTGLPETLYKCTSDDAAVQRFGAVLLNVARRGVRNRFRPSVPQLERYGINRLGLALIFLSLWYEESRCDAYLMHLLGSGADCQRLQREYRALAEAVAGEARRGGIEPEAVRRVTFLNAARCALPAAELYRASVIQQCEQVLAECVGDPVLAAARLQSVVDGISAFARRVLAPTCQQSCVVWQDGSDDVSFDARWNEWRVRRRGTVSAVPWPLIAAPEPEALSLETYRDLEQRAERLAFGRC